MAASIEQKVDYLLKKIGYTASKTGIAEDSSLSGTKKAPFAEALPSPLVVPATSIYGQSESIPATPPGATSGVVEVYGTATAFQMTEDNTVSGQRSWSARSVQGNNTSAMVGDWIDTQFGSDYIINVYAGDPNAGGTKLSAAGSGSNDTWFFDYASGVLNFNGDAAPTAVTGGADIYLVGYRYTGTKGATGAGGNFTNAVVGVLTVTGTITAQSDIIGDGASNLIGFNSITGASYYLQDGLDAAQNVFTVSGTDVSLNGIDAIDATTKATLEASLAIAPNEFNDIVVSGLSTFNGNIDLNADIEGNGSNVITGLGSMTVGILTATKATLGTGSTITGIGYIEQLSVADPSTFASDLTVNGVLTADSLQVNTPLENVVITDVNITGDALVGGALTVAGGITGNLTGDVVGTASSANQVLVTAELSSSTVHYINFSEQATDPTDLHRDSTLTYTPSTDTLAATNVSATTLTASGEVEGGSLDINGAGDISGNLDVGGNLTVAGTLTYEDVTDIDSVGLITARSGIHVLAGGIDVQAGVVTSADGFAGDLTGNVTGNLTGEVNAAAFDTNADGTVTTGIATASGFSGPLVGSVTGNVVGDLTGEVNAAAFDTNANGIVVTGVATATAFVGDGSGLTNINQAINGQDVSVRNAQVGGALTVTGATTAADITSSGTVDAATFAVSGTNVLETVSGQRSLSGIQTIDATTQSTLESLLALAPNDFNSINVTGVGTFGGKLNANGGLEVVGHSELDDLNVSGVATVTGALDANGGAALSGGVTADELTVVGFTTVGGDLLANSNLDVTDQTTLNTLRATGVTTFVTDVNFGGDIIGDGSTDISGIASVTATEFYGDGSNLTGLEAGLDGLNVTLGDVTVGGALTVTGATDINGDIDIDGHAELDQLRVSGVSTFVGGATFQENLAILGQGSIQTLVVAGNSSLQDTQVGGGLTVTGATDLNGAVSVAGTSEFNDVVRVNDTLFANGAVEVANGQGLTVGNIFTVDSNGESPIFSVDIEADFNEGINVDGEVGGNAGILTTGDLAGTIAGLDIAPRHINAAGFATVAQGLEVASGGADITGFSTFAGDLYLTGNATFGNDATDTVTVNADVASNLIPDGNNTRDLGDISNRWGTVYSGDINTTTLNVADDVTIGGNLSVGGTITSAELIELDIIAPVIELGLEAVGDGTLQPPSSQTNYSSGTAMWYNRVGVSSDNAQAAAMFADLKPTGTYRIGFATDVTLGDDEVLGAVNGWAEIEAKALWMNDCAGESVVINCTGTERFLNNITIDGGTF